MPLVSALRLLLIEDNPNDAELLQRELRRHGFAPTTTRVADEQALRSMLAQRWDVVVSDWVMPGFDGLSALKVVRELDEDVPFIVCSGTIDEESAVVALKAGAQDFVSKNKLTRFVPAIQRELREAEDRRTRKKADAEVARQRQLVQQSEDRYRSLFDNSPLPMWTYDRKTLKFVAVNDAAVRHYGYSRDEFLAMTLADIRPSSDIAALKEEVARSRGFSDRRLWRHRKKDGSLISVEVQANDVAVDGHELRLALINDVTERERPSRRPLSLWIALAALVAVAMLSVASTTRLMHTMDRVDHTHRLIALLGTVDVAFQELIHDAGNASDLRIEEALSAVASELAADLEPDNATQTQHLNELRRAIAARSERDVVRLIDEMRLPALGRLDRQRDETSSQVTVERIAQLGAMALSISILWVVFSRMLRESRLRRAAEEASRRSEESLATMLHSIGDAVIATDIAGRVIRINRVAEQLTGWRMSEAMGRPFEEVFRIVDEPSRVAASNPVEKVLAEGRNVAIAENTLLISRAGPETPIADSAAPIRDADGRVVGAVVVFRDASIERRYAEHMRSVNAELEVRVSERTEALLKTEEQLRQAQKMEAVGRLAGGIAHDFNNLLSVIISCSELILEDAARDGLPENVVTDLDEIRKAGVRAADLTRQLLAFSRQQVLAPKITDLNAIVSGMESMLRRMIGADVTLRTVREADAAMVFVDRGQMEQVIMNLAVNARDAMPRGGKLTIEVSRVEVDEDFASQHAGIAPGAYVQLSVTDTGTGMSKDVQARMFDPFFTTKEKGKGTGLGLSTVFGIVRQSGGTIWAYSEIGHGTTFKIYLPNRQDAQAQTSITAAPKRVGGTETILVVEDEPQVRSIVRGILTRAGYTVLEAEHGAAALELCHRATTPIQLVLTDVVMPVMSGRELVERLATVLPGAKVLFMSGYTDDTVVHHGVLDQGIAYLQKPIVPDALTKKVREVLDT